MKYHQVVHKFLHACITINVARNLDFLIRENELIIKKYN